MNLEAIIETLRGVLKEAVVEDVDLALVSAETTIESLGLDSLSILDLLYDVEQELGVGLDAADIVDVKTVGDIAELIRERLDVG